MINCEKASSLTSKKIDKKLSFWEKISLKLHNLICRPCSNFEDEAHLLSEVIKQEYNNSQKSMSLEGKEKIKKLLETEMK